MVTCLFAGRGDGVLCFSCGNGLNNWEPQDTPWEEHARWHGVRCVYVQLVKGRGFVDKARLAHPLPEGYEAHDRKVEARWREDSGVGEVDYLAGVNFSAEHNANEHMDNHNDLEFENDDGEDEDDVNGQDDSGVDVCGIY